LFTDDIVVCVENLKESTGKPLEAITRLKVTRLTHKVILIHTISEQGESEIKNMVPLT
jgi:hypothetical protein